MSKEIPILFSTPMVQAILAGNKTMTRRIVKDASKIKTKGEIVWGYSAFTPKGSISMRTKLKTTKGHTYGEVFFKQKWGKGDILWVRESAYPAFKSTPESSGHIYKADYGFKTDLIKEYNPAGGWKPSIHMPKVAARIWLEVREVKVERLQDITDDDCFSEGLQSLVNRGRAGLSKGSDGSARGTFRDLWNSINDNWDENPWVWVVSFNVLSTTGKP